MDQGNNGLSRGDRNRNARLAALRAAVPRDHAILGIDLAQSRQAAVLADHDSRVIARWRPRCSPWKLGELLERGLRKALSSGFAGITVACEPTGHRWMVISQLAAERGSVTPRYCETCGARLASDNSGTTCRPCQRIAHERSKSPPEVPPEFWDNHRLKDALVAERHIGHAVRTWRNHPFWHRPISQEVAARWLSISQTQLSRIENGRPIYDLDRLANWAKTLRIPPELLWFALPDEGDVRRRQFLLAGGVTAAGMFSENSVKPRTGRLLTDEDCAQWLAWELWNRKASALPAEELPPEIRRTLESLPLAGSIILRDGDANYSFAHQSLVDFFVAQRVFAGLADGKSELLATAQTSHDTDQIIRKFVQHQESCVPTLTHWMRDGATSVLRVNSAGILAKLGDPGICDEVIAVLRSDAEACSLYLTAVASRVFAMPWDQAANLAAVPSKRLGHTTILSTGHTADLAMRLGQEVRRSADGAARWCSIVLLSKIYDQTPEAVKGALREALDKESCRENLRAIGVTLTDGDPLHV